MTDSELMQLLNADINRGMEQLISQYNNLVYITVKQTFAGYPRFSTDIDDCVADTFSDFCNVIPKFDIKRSSIKHFLCIMAAKKVIDVLRKKRHVSLETIILNITQRDFKSDVETSDLYDKIFEYIKSLKSPDSDLAISRLRYGESSEILAKRHNMSVSAVNTRIHRIMKKIRVQFSDEYFS